MEFKKQQTIYMQIADYICESIMLEETLEGDKIASVRDFASQIEVNPNTVMRTYSYLQEVGIITNKRGIGFFVNEGASQNIIEMQRQDFILNVLPDIFKKMKMLDVNFDEIKELYLKSELENTN